MKDPKRKDFIKARMYFEEALRYEENPEILYYMSDLAAKSNDMESSNEYASQAIVMSYKMPAASYDLIPQEDFKFV